MRDGTAVMYELGGVAVSERTRAFCVVRMNHFFKFQLNLLYGKINT